MKLKNFVQVALAVVGCELVGFLGSLFTTPAIAGWYVHVVKPQLAPPNWVFAPVWTMLFAFMGIAAFLVWRQGLARRAVRIALGLFAVQLVLNLLWSIIFFGWHNPGGALGEIIILWLAILASLIAFARVSRPAAWLFVPYLLWVTFAAYLNYAIWALN